MCKSPICITKISRIRIYESIVKQKEHLAITHGNDKIIKKKKYHNQSV